MNRINRFRLVLLATIVWMIVMRIYSPPNIVQFEFAGTSAMAHEIISEWGEDGIALASISIYLDFIFLVLYGSSFFLACRIASDFSKNRQLIHAGLILSWASWFAALCDAVENIAMLSTLAEISQTTLSISWYFAAVKFGVLAILLVFILTSSIIGLLKKTV
jgi:hypothetical protein